MDFSAARGALVAAAMLVLQPARARAEETTEPPPITPVRYAEDYTYLRAPDPGAMDALSPWAPVKFIPLNQERTVHLTLGTEVRARYEWLQNANWGLGPQDPGGYLWLRALPLADLHAGDHVRVFGQVISAFALGLAVPAGPVDEDRLDVLQAFVDVDWQLPFDGGATATVRVGRQLLTFGSGRLIDIRYGPNVLQAFDGVRASVEGEAWNVQALFALPTDHQTGVFDDGFDRSQTLWSLYGTLDSPSMPTGLDVYYIGYRADAAEWEQGSGRELRHTLGARVFRNTGTWDWNVELFAQLGRFDAAEARGRILAWSVGSDLGHSWESSSLRPRAGLKTNLISGDGDLNDPDVGTFNPLFPKGKYFGELSPIAPVNLLHVNPNASFSIGERIRLSANLAFYFRESTAEGIYALGALTVLRSGGASDARFIGTQAEVLAELQADRHLSLTASYSVFTAGQYLRESGPGRTSHFVGLEAMYRF